jgi:hypothetical protein
MHMKAFERKSAKNYLQNLFYHWTNIIYNEKTKAVYVSPPLIACKVLSWVKFLPSPPSQIKSCSNYYWLLFTTYVDATDQKSDT